MQTLTPHSSEPSRPAQHRPRALGRQGDGRVAGRRGLVDGQGAVVGTEAQRVRQPEGQGKSQPGSVRAP